MVMKQRDKFRDSIRTAQRRRWKVGNEVSYHSVYPAIRLIHREVKERAKCEWTLPPRIQ